MSLCQITTAHKKDLSEIASIHAQCWRDAYAFMPAEIINNRSENYRLEQWKAWMKSPAEAERLFMVRIDGVAVGFCFAKPNDDPDAPRALGELHAGYLLPAWRGSSAGPRMMLAMVEFLEEVDRVPLVLWAFRQNPIRIWYAQLGWKKFIERHRIIAGVGVPETGYLSPPLDGLKHRLETMIQSCDARADRLQKKRFYQLGRVPHLADFADSDTSQ